MKYIISFFMLFISFIGCNRNSGFPEQAMNFQPSRSSKSPAALPRTLDYDTDGDGADDFRMHLGETGQIESIQYQKNNVWGQPIILSNISNRQCIHVFLILSGLDYATLQKAYHDGAMRFCPPPIRMLCPFPALSDSALSEMFGNDHPAAYCKFYFHKTENNTLVRTKNKTAQPYENMINYQAGMWTSFLDKFSDKQAFKSDLKKCKKALNNAKNHEFIAYLRTTRPLLAEGESASQHILWTIDQFCKELIWKRRGQIKITITSDVPAIYQACKTAELKEELQEKGFAFKKILSDKKDVGFMEIEYSRYAGFWTLKPARLAHELAQMDGVELASFSNDGRIVVIAPNGQMAYVVKKGRGLRYEPVTGDPLKLNKLLNPKQFYTADSLMKATALYEFPAPLQRLWQAHFENVQYSPSVIVSLSKEYFAADGFRAEAKKIDSPAARCREIIPPFF